MEQKQSMHISSGNPDEPYHNPHYVHAVEAELADLRAENERLVRQLQKEQEEHFVLYAKQKWQADDLKSRLVEVAETISNYEREHEPFASLLAEVRAHLGEAEA